MPKKSFFKVFHIFGVLSFVATLSSLVITPNTHAQVSSTTSAPTAPTLPQTTTASPKVKLITVTCTPETCTTNGQLDWSKASFSNNQQYTDYTCSGNAPFANQPVLGIDDYKDGISVQTFKGYPDIQVAKNDYATKKMACSYMNEKAGNLQACDYTLLTVETYADSQRPRTQACMVTRSSAQSQGTATSNPVFAYQFRYNTSFTEANKVTQSNAYRSMTGIEGTYEGVNMTYTYYTYTKDGQFLSWENPHKDNVYGGWLVYGSQNGGIVSCLSLDCPSLAPQSSTQSSMMSKSGDIVNCLSLDCPRSSSFSNSTQSSMMSRSADGIVTCLALNCPGQGSQSSAMSKSGDIVTCLSLDCPGSSSKSSIQSSLMSN